MEANFTALHVLAALAVVGAWAAAAGTVVACRRINALKPPKPKCPKGYVGCTGGCSTRKYTDLRPLVPVESLIPAPVPPALAVKQIFPDDEVQLGVWLDDGGRCPTSP